MLSDIIAPGRLRAGDPATLAALVAVGGWPVVSYAERARAGGDLAEAVVLAFVAFRRRAIDAGGRAAADLDRILLESARDAVDELRGDTPASAEARAAEDAFARASPRPLSPRLATRVLRALVEAAPVKGEPAAILASAERSYAEAYEAADPAPPVAGEERLAPASPLLLRAIEESIMAQALGAPQPPPAEEAPPAPARDAPRAGGRGSRRRGGGKEPSPPADVPAEPPAEGGRSSRGAEPPAGAKDPRTEAPEGRRMPRSSRGAEPPLSAGDPGAEPAEGERQPRAEPPEGERPPPAARAPEPPRDGERASRSARAAGPPAERARDPRSSRAAGPPAERARDPRSSRASEPLAEGATDPRAAPGPEPPPERADEPPPRRAGQPPPAEAPESPERAPERPAGTKRARPPRAAKPPPKRAKAPRTAGGRRSRSRRTREPAAAGEAPPARTPPSVPAALLPVLARVQRLPLAGRAAVGGAVLLLLLLAVTLLAGGDEAPRGTALESPTTTVTVGAPESARPLVRAKPREPITASGARFEVVPITEAAWARRISERPLREGDRWVTVAVRARSLTRDGLPLAGLDYRVRTRSHLIVGPRVVELTDPRDALRDGRLPTDAQASVHLGFEVPQDAGELAFAFEPGGLDGGPTVIVPLGG